MSTPFCSTSFVRRTLALSAILGASFAVMSAQTTTATEQTAPLPAATPSLNLQLPAAYSSSDTTLSSSSADNEVAMNSDRFNFVDAMQYGGRRRAGRPRYRGGNTNPDGSNKWMFFAGAGFTAPVGDNTNYLKTSYGFQVGGGRQFNKHIAVPIQFDWDNFGFTGQTISNQAYLYFEDPANDLYGLDGNSHIWSFTVDPTFNIGSDEGVGAYVVVGGGFYHKEASFFVPVEAEACDFYCYDYTANETIQNYSSNSAGLNGGFGLTYKLSKFASERLYAEVRIVHTFNQYKPGITAADSVSTIQNYTGWNYFPQNSQSTTYFPVKFGIRF